MTQGEPLFDADAIAEQIGYATHEPMQRDAQAALVFEKAMANLEVTSITDLVPDYAGIDDLFKIDPALLDAKYSTEQITGAVTSLRDGLWFELPTVRPYLRDMSMRPYISDTTLLVNAIRSGTFIGHMGKVQRMHELRQMGMSEAQLETTIIDESKSALASQLFGSLMKGNALIERMNDGGQQTS